MKTIYPKLVLIALIFPSCETVQRLSTTEKTYADTRSAPETFDTTYALPLIKPTAKTQQMQVKGGVTISAEIVPFAATRYVKTDRTIGYADVDKPGYDVYEITNTPFYTVMPEDIQFKIRIRNNEAVPLKLSEVGFALIIDGTQWSFPTGYLDDWNKGLILTGFEKEYTVKGPQLKGLVNAQVVYLFLNGVPTSYNEAGNVTKKSNFEWYFECKSQEIKKSEQRTFTYETSPILREKCSSCSGIGYFEKIVSCYTCSGKGSYVYQGKTVQCYSCYGKGIVKKTEYCQNCKGKGEISYPKSKSAPVTSSISWDGWRVNVATNPPGAKVSVVNTKTGQYESKGMSNIDLNWYSSNEKSFPILIEYQSRTVKVLPYDENGKPSSRVNVDFLGGTPNVIKGKMVN